MPRRISKLRMRVNNLDSLLTLYPQNIKALLYNIMLLIYYRNDQLKYRSGNIQIYTTP